MSRTKSKPQKPSECIQKCPACGSKALYRMEVDVFCFKCDWLSCEMHVEAGGMDNIFSAYIDHFYGSTPAVKQTSQAQAKTPRNTLNSRWKQQKMKKWRPSLPNRNTLTFDPQLIIYKDRIKNRAQKKEIKMNASEILNPSFPEMKMSKRGKFSFSKLLRRQGKLLERGAKNIANYVSNEIQKGHEIELRVNEQKFESQNNYQRLRQRFY